MSATTPTGKNSAAKAVRSAISCYKLDTLVNDHPPIPTEPFSFFGGAFWASP